MTDKQITQLTNEQLESILIRQGCSPEAARVQVAALDATAWEFKQLCDEYFAQLEMDLEQLNLVEW